jgi:hypothetical protein
LEQTQTNETQPASNSSCSSLTLAFSSAFWRIILLLFILPSFLPPQPRIFLRIRRLFVRARFVILRIVLICSIYATPKSSISAWARKTGLNLALGCTEKLFSREMELKMDD